MGLEVVVEEIVAGEIVETADVAGAGDDPVAARMRRRSGCLAQS